MDIRADISLGPLLACVHEQEWVCTFVSGVRREKGPAHLTLNQHVGSQKAEVYSCDVKGHVHTQCV